MVNSIIKKDPMRGLTYLLTRPRAAYLPPPQTSKRAGALSPSFACWASNFLETITALNTIDFALCS